MQNGLLHCAFVKTLTNLTPLTCLADGGTMASQTYTHKHTNTHAQTHHHHHHHHPPERVHTESMTEVLQQHDLSLDLCHWAGHSWQPPNGRQHE